MQTPTPAADAVLLPDSKTLKVTEHHVSTSYRQSGPEVIKLFSCSTQLSMKF